MPHNTSQLLPLQGSSWTWSCHTILHNYCLYMAVVGHGHATQYCTTTAFTWQYLDMVMPHNTAQLLPLHGSSWTWSCHTILHNYCLYRAVVGHGHATQYFTTTAFTWQYLDMVMPHNTAQLLPLHGSTWPWSCHTILHNYCLYMAVLGHGHATQYCTTTAFTWQYLDMVMPHNTSQLLPLQGSSWTWSCHTILHNYCLYMTVLGHGHATQYFTTTAFTGQ